MFENTAIRIIVGLIILMLGYLLLKFFSVDKEESITEYAAPAYNKIKPTILKRMPKRGILKKIQPIAQAEKTVSWAPSPIDAHISEYGEFDTNRNPPNFVTNVAKGFPENDQGSSFAPPTKWTQTDVNKRFPATIPNVSTTGEYAAMGMPLPDIGSENVFEGDFGASLDN